MAAEPATVRFFLMGKPHDVPKGLTIQKAMEYSGYRLLRGCGCRGGFCGACGTVYRIGSDYRLKVGLAQCAIRYGKGEDGYQLVSEALNESPNDAQAGLVLGEVACRTQLVHGLPIAISTDAHAVAELGFMRWGVDQARRGWASKADVVNTLPLAKLRKRLHGARR